MLSNENKPQRYLLHRNLNIQSGFVFFYCAWELRILGNKMILAKKRVLSSCIPKIYNKQYTYRLHPEYFSVRF